MFTTRCVSRRVGAGAVLLLFVLIAPAVSFADPPAKIEKVTTIEGVTEYRLANGLRVLLYPDPSASKISVNCTVFVGSRDEGHGETGMAHLLEHMNIKCTSAHADIKKTLSDRGAHWNANTSRDRTMFFETMPATGDNLEFAIALEADRLMNCLIRREDLASEMTVVRNEFEMGANSPSQILFQRVIATAYEWHNYGKAVIGNRSDIERVKVENLRAFYRKHYRPDNAMLIVAGKFDESKALESIASRFGPIKNPPVALERLRTEEPAQDGGRNVELRRVGSIGQVMAMYHIPGAAHPDFAALIVLAQSLATQPRGRLYQSLVASKKSSDMAAFAMALQEPGVFCITAQADKGQSLDDIRQIMLKSIESIATDKLSADEVKHAREELTSGWDRQSCFELADGLSEWAARGDWRLMFLHRDRLAKVTTEDVNRVAATYFVATNRTLGSYIPAEKPDRIEIPQTSDIAALLKEYKGNKAISAGEAFDPTPENIERRLRRLTLPSGVKVALLPRKTRGETVSLVLVLRYGNEQSLAGLSEACEYLPALMRRGTQKHDFKAFDAELPKLGNAGITASGAVGRAVFTVSCQRKYLPGSLELLGEMLRQPTLPQNEFETIQRATVEMVRSQLKEPAPQSLQLLRRKLHPHEVTDLRYVPTLDEAIKRYGSVTVEQVRKLYAEQLSGDSGELVLVGDFDPDAVVAQVQQMLSGWTKPVKYQRIATQANTEVAGSREVIRTPDKANAIFRAAHLLAVKASDADYPALLVGNYILGQPGTQSRLWSRLREKDGLSYHVESAFSASMLDPDGGFEIAAICNPANMAKVRTGFTEEINRLLENGVTQAELDAAKKAILAARRTFSDAEILYTLADHLFEGDNYALYEQRSERISELTVEQVNAALRKHLQPKKMVIVEAGDFDSKSAAAPVKSSPGNP